MRTLSDWHLAFNQQAERLQELGYDERLFACGAIISAIAKGILERSISTVQLLMSRPQWR